MENRYGSWAFYALVGACFLTFLSVRDYWKGLALKKEGVETAAMVRDIEESRGRRGRVTYTPVVAFTDQDGKACSLKTSGGSSNRYQVGQEVKIIYLPKDTTCGEMSDGFVMKGDKTLLWISGGLWGLTFVLGGLFFRTKNSSAAMETA